MWIPSGAYRVTVAHFILVLLILATQLILENLLEMLYFVKNTDTQSASGVSSRASTEHVCYSIFFLFLFLFKNDNRG